ncbi:MAG TPA: hypothetical protein VEC12_10205, partial [Bacteroidia bacterium]|nr:hypothetical protein [Bacteroidia bacterium]
MKILYKKANGIKMFLTSIVLCFSLGVAMAQPALMWQKTYGGSDNDVVPIIWQTADSGYIMAGSSVSADQQVSGHHGPAGGYNNDIWVVKTDNSGTLQWENSFGGAGNEAAYYVQQTTDGGYIVVGVTDTANGDVTNWHTGHIGSLRTTDFWVVKLFPNGTIEWEKSFGGSKNDWATAAQQTADGGYIIAGFTNSTDGDATGGGYHSDPFQPNANDYWVVKISAGGAIQWQHCYGGKYEERPYSIHQTSQDRGYIVAGEAKGAADGDVGANYGNSDVWAIKIDSNGTLQWEKNYGGTGYDRANFVRHTA